MRASKLHIACSKIIRRVRVGSRTPYFLSGKTMQRSAKQILWLIETVVAIIVIGMVAPVHLHEHVLRAFGLCCGDNRIYWAAKNDGHANLRGYAMIVGSFAMATAILLAFLRVPLAFALLAQSIVWLGMVINWNTAFLLLPMTISDAVLSYDLAVVQMFILMGNVISRTGIAHDLFKAAYAFVGHVRGGLALSTIVACSGFAAVSGSSYATAATIAKVAYPSMKKYGYADELAAGTIAAGGTLGILIRPSIIMVVYGILTQTNIGHLFIAGVVSWIFGLLMYMIAVRIVAALNPDQAPKGERTPWALKLRALAGVWPFILLFGLIIGGLYGKLFTPTEAAGMGAGISILIAFGTGRLSGGVFRAVIIETIYTTVALYAALFSALMLS